MARIAVQRHSQVTSDESTASAPHLIQPPGRRVCPAEGKVAAEGNGLVATKVGSALGRGSALMMAVLLAVASSSCQPPGTDLVPAAPAGEECSCAGIVGILEGNTPENWRQDAEGPEL